MQRDTTESENIRLQDGPDGGREGSKEPEHAEVQKSSGDNETLKESNKRLFDDSDDEFDPFNPAGVKVEKKKKKITGGLIDKYWDLLDPEPRAIIDGLLAIAMNRTLEKFDESKKAGQVRWRETEKILIDSWVGKDSFRSFASRLEVTKLPPVNTMKTKHSSDSQEATGSSFLNLDQLTREKQYLETHLLAELKQLQELDLHYNNLETAYNLDLRYLSEFSKTISMNEQKMQKDLAKKKASLNLEDAGTDAIENLSHRKTVNFDANSDEEVKELLNTLSNHLGSLSSNTKSLASFNDKIEVLYNMLEMI